MLDHEEKYTFVSFRPKVESQALLFACLFLAILGLRCWSWASSSWGEPGLLFVRVCGLLVEVASFIPEHSLEVHGLSSCDAQA